jgi:hypothetical protein
MLILILCVSIFLGMLIQETFAKRFCQRFATVDNDHQTSNLKPKEDPID